MKLYSNNLRDECGFTVIELVMAMVITGIVAALFSMILSSVIEIYADRTVRKNSHIDERRSSAMTLHDIRQLQTWVGGQSSTSIVFDRSNMEVTGGGVDYYNELQVGFTIGNEQLSYQTEAGGNWANLYPLIIEGVIAGDTNFAITTAGGVDRLTNEIFLSVHGKPMQVRFAVFPRSQGG